MQRAFSLGAHAEEGALAARGTAEEAEGALSVAAAVAEGAGGRFVASAGLVKLSVEAIAFATDLSQQAGALTQLVVAAGGTGGSATHVVVGHVALTVAGRLHEGVNRRHHVWLERIA